MQRHSAALEATAMMMVSIRACSSAKSRVSSLARIEAGSMPGW